MNITTHELGFEALDSLGDVDALLIFVAEDERPLQGLAGYLDWRMVGGLSRVLKDKFFEGALDDWLLLPTSGRFPVQRIFALGVGPSATLKRERVAQVLASAGTRLRKAGMKSVALEIPGVEQLDETTRAEVFQVYFVPAFAGERVAVLAPKTLQKAVVTAARHA